MSSLFSTNMSHFLKVSKFCIFNQVHTSCTKRSGLLLCHHHYHEAESESSAWASIKSCEANYVPLTPISFLERAANVFSERTSVIYGPYSVLYTREQTYARCLKLASALVHHLSISRGDVVATLAPNVPAIQELHFAVPVAGAVLCTLNTRLDPAMISTLLMHSEAKIIFVDQQWPITEFDPISINYTSGSTSRPKGVVYSHRGAYLNSIAAFLLHEMSTLPIYLWTVPTFHCNGWCLIWGLAAVGGTNVCLRSVSPREIFESISLYKVTHMSGAPTVLNMIAKTPSCDRKRLPHKVKIVIRGSPPPPQIISRMEELGFGVNHLCGLTETYAAGTYCLWKPEWDFLPSDERFILKARQGVQHLCVEEVDVTDSITMKKVPADGVTMGEVMFRGNTVMSYIEVKDRLKDIIISGGENISTVEVETVLYSHPAVLRQQ
ncbi:putative acyl-activating enzyme 2 [Capsicum chinense]|nr:putative acyl-activating enzyme 2 [Capsicum chinense]